jgi:acyl-coenzyme A synthetase/AMP-(fatty) acid ligase
VAAPVLHSFGAADVEGALAQIDPALVLELGPDVISDPVALAEVLGGAPVPAGGGPAKPADVAQVLFTSGSTGIPKAVLHTHRGLSWKASLMAEVHGLGADDAVLMPAPMAHISGLLNGVLVPGASTPSWRSGSCVTSASRSWRAHRRSSSRCGRHSPARRAPGSTCPRCGSSPAAARR